MANQLRWTSKSVDLYVGKSSTLMPDTNKNTVRWMVNVEEHRGVDAFGLSLLVCSSVADVDMTLQRRPTTDCGTRTSCTANGKFETNRSDFTLTLIPQLLYTRGWCCMRFQSDVRACVFASRLCVGDLCTNARCTLQSPTSNYTCTLCHPSPTLGSIAFQLRLRP